MARSISPSLRRLIPQENQMPGSEFEELPVKVLEAPDLTKGMVTSVPRSDVDIGSFVIGKNARTTATGLKRRPGTVQFQSAVADGGPILLLTGNISQAAIGRLIAITGGNVYYSQDGKAFIAFTNSATDVLDGSLLRPSVTFYLDDMYIAGWSELLVVTNSTSEVTAVEDGPGQGKFIANFGDRVILANFNDEPYKVKWCANADPTNWSTSSSGEENLVQGAGDLGNDITGLFEMDDELVILRKSSIWIMERQPFAEAPFKFTKVVSGFGCDLPHSAVRVPGGILYADRATNGVYLYQRGQYPQRISSVIDNDLFVGLTNPDWVQGSFDPSTFSYHLGLTQSLTSTTMQKFWVYSLLRKAWTFDDNLEAQAISFFSSSSGISIDSLTGTIDDLSGTINDQTNFDIFTRHYLGLPDGKVVNFDDSVDVDFDESTFNFIAQSPNLGSLSTRRTLTDLMISISFSLPGEVTLEQSKDGETWVNTKTVELSGNRLSARRNLVTGNDIYWRVRAEATDVELLSWWARLQEKGFQTA